MSCPTVLHWGSAAFTDPRAAEQRGQRRGQVGCQGPGFDLCRGSDSAKISQSTFSSAHVN